MSRIYVDFLLIGFGDAGLGLRVRLILDCDYFTADSVLRLLFQLIDNMIGRDGTQKRFDERYWVSDG
jgi:hypothetical protein